MLPVLGVPIDAISAPEALQRIMAWADAGESRVVCCCNAHSVVTAAQDAGFMRVLSGADLATPDGAPVAWLLRLQGAKGQPRVSGPDLMWDYCAHAAAHGQALFLLGSAPATLERLRSRLLESWPSLHIAGALSPPFRPLSEEEDLAVLGAIRASGARTIWVSLGCPQQERWMAAHRKDIAAVQVGVGAAFDFLAGTRRRAPRWMRRCGLEWLHRLASEPRRLWRRYLLTNWAFIQGGVRQLCCRAKAPRP